MLDLVLVIDELLAKGYRVDVEKALDPLDPRDFVTLVNRFASRLGRIAQPHEIDAVDKALSAMDVDWPNLTDRQRTAAVRAANTAIRALGERVTPEITGTITATAKLLVQGTRRSVERKFDLGIRTGFNESDKKLVEAAARNQGNFVTDYYGRRAQFVEEQARAVVAAGLSQGHGTDEIAAKLESTVKAATLGRSSTYWDVVANAFANRARTETHLRGFKEAGVRSWMFEAVLDEVTTDQCRMLHGKTFDVNAALRRMEATQASEDPIRAIKEHEPWMYNGRDQDGRLVLYTRNLDGTRNLIAHVLETGVGTADKIGRYDQVVSDDALMKSGIPMPPLHGRCRSTVLPVF